LEIDHRQNWQQKQLNQIANSYEGAANFEAVFAWFTNWMDKSCKYHSLADLNSMMIQDLWQKSGLKKHFILSSELPVTGKSQYYIINIVKFLNGGTYLSGLGAKKYQDNKAFGFSNIRLQYVDYTSTPYFQGQGNWIPGLSILDALINGKEHNFIQKFK
jgi:hypothetical protein